MRDRWQDFETEAKRGPRHIGVKVGCWLFVIVVILGAGGIALNVLGFFGGAVTNATAVAKKEFYPDALLKKYEWFKDAAAGLDKKVADMKVYEGRFKRLENDYKGIARPAWAKDDREQWSIWQSEAAGVKASYNGLAAEYNAQMSKFNWRFTNVGDLPSGASSPLPREYKTYVED